LSIAYILNLGTLSHIKTYSSRGNSLLVDTIFQKNPVGTVTWYIYIRGCQSYKTKCAQWKRVIIRITRIFAHISHMSIIGREPQYLIWLLKHFSPKYVASPDLPLQSCLCTRPQRILPAKQHEYYWCKM
jgi:hypothetical protein